MTSTTKNTIPAAGASFFADLQTFLREEEPDRFRDMFTGFIVSGGTHSTGAGLVHTPASLTAYPGGHYITETGAITYPDAATHIWVICHKDTTTAVTDWTRVSGTHYLFRNTGSATKPALPVVESAILMKVTTSGGAVTVVEDHRELAPVAELTSDIDTGAVFNESGLSAYNFRIESNLNPNMFFVDAGNNSVHIDNLLLTGAGDGDLVMANSKFLRWINNAGTSSANYGVQSTAADAMQFRIPSNTGTFSFHLNNVERIRFQEQNGGMGILLSNESSADHGNPAGTGCILSLKDVAGKTALFARFNTGVAQQIAIEP